MMKHRETECFFFFSSPATVYRIPGFVPVRVSENYNEISHFGECYCQHDCPIYRDICIISLCTCTAVQHIDPGHGKTGEEGGTGEGL